MQGLRGFLAAVVVPALFVSIFGFAIASEIRQLWKMRHQWAESSQLSTVRTIKELFKFTVVSVWMILMLFVIYGELRIRYDLWALQPSKVEEVKVGEHRFTDQSSKTEIINALSEWYSVNHGGWGDETPIVLKMVTGTEWRMRAGYHFAQHGAVVLRSSEPSGRGWQLGRVFSPTLPGVLEQLGVPLSHCEAAHAHPCRTSQASSR